MVRANAQLKAVWTNAALTRLCAAALLSVYDKAGLLPFAAGLAAAGIKLLGSGGTAKAIRNAGMEIG